MADASIINIALSESDLDQSEGVQYVGDPRAGGIASFAGVTRSFTDGKETIRLSYEAYEGMAETTMREIATEIFERLDLCKIWMRHRTGVVPAGEPSVVIVVSAPHRGQAFEACRYLIDELKERVPIWKKEHFADGTEEWVDPTARP